MNRDFPVTADDARTPNFNNLIFVLANYNAHKIWFSRFWFNFNVYVTRVKMVPFNVAQVFQSFPFFSSIVSLVSVSIVSCMGFNKSIFSFLVKIPHNWKCDLDVFVSKIFLAHTKFHKPLTNLYYSMIFSRHHFACSRRSNFFFFQKRILRSPP